MSKKRTTEVVKPKTSFPIYLAPKDNTSKSLENWKSAKEQAESIFNPLRKPLIDLYENIVLDPHLSSVMEKRILSITNTSWTFSLDGEPVENIDPMCNRHFFEQLLTYIITAKFWGASVIETDFNRGTCELVPRGHCVPEFKIVLTEPYMSDMGIAYDLPPFDRTVIDVVADDLGLLYKVAPYVLLKKGDISDWATFCEVFGMPTRVGKYDPNTPGNEAQLRKALQDMGSNAWMAIPTGSEIEFPESTQKTGNDIYERFAQFCNAEISKGIVGNTMTTEVGKNGSRSQGEVHERGEDDIKRADRRFVERILNERIIPLLIKQGFAIPEGAEFKAIEDEAELSKAEQLKMDLDIHKNVAPIKLEHFAEEYDVEFDEVELKKREKQTQAAQQQQPQQSKTIKNADILTNEKSKNSPLGVGGGQFLKIEKRTFVDKILNLFDFFDQAPKS